MLIIALWAGYERRHPHPLINVRRVLNLSAYLQMPNAAVGHGLSQTVLQVAYVLRAVSIAVVVGGFVYVLANVLWGFAFSFAYSGATAAYLIDATPSEAAMYSSANTVIVSHAQLPGPSLEHSHTGAPQRTSQILLWHAERELGGLEADRPEPSATSCPCPEHDECLSPYDASIGA